MAVGKKKEPLARNTNADDDVYAEISSLAFSSCELNHRTLGGTADICAGRQRDIHSHMLSGALTARWVDVVRSAVDS